MLYTHQNTSIEGDVCTYKQSLDTKFKCFLAKGPFIILAFSQEYREYSFYIPLPYLKA